MNHVNEGEKSEEKKRKKNKHILLPLLERAR